MGSSRVILLVLAMWPVLFVFSVLFPLITGRTRMGKSGSPPILRDEEPGRFWAVVALSVVLLCAAAAITTALMKHADPRGWAEAMRTLHAMRRR